MNTVQMSDNMQPVEAMSGNMQPVGVPNAEHTSPGATALDELDPEALGFTSRELEPIFVLNEPFALELTPEDLHIENPQADSDTDLDQKTGARTTAANENTTQTAAVDFWDQVANFAHTYSGEKRGDVVQLAIAAATRLSSDATRKQTEPTAQQPRPTDDVTTWTAGSQLAAGSGQSNTGESQLRARYDRAKLSEKISRYLETQAKDAAIVAFGTRGSAVRAARRY